MARPNQRLNSTRQHIFPQLRSQRCRFGYFVHNPKVLLVWLVPYGLRGCQYLRLSLLFDLGYYYQKQWHIYSWKRQFLCHKFWGNRRTSINNGHCLLSSRFFRTCAKTTQKLTKTHISFVPHICTGNIRLPLHSFHGFFRYSTFY